MLPLLLLLLTGIASAQPKAPSCATPRDAAASLLDWLQSDSWDPEKAATCLDVPETSAEDAPRLAIQLKQVLDARALYVPVDTYSPDADYADDFGEHRLVLMEEFPVVVLEKVGEEWLYSRSTMTAVPSLYEQTFSRALLELQKRLPTAFFSQIFGIHLWQYLYFVLLAASALLFGRFAQWVLDGQVVRIAKHFGLATNAVLIRRIQWPLTWFVVGVIFRWGVPDLQLGIRPTLFLVFLATSILSISAVLIASRIVDVVADLFDRRAEKTDSKLDDQVIPLINRAVKSALWALGLVFILQNVGVEVTALLAGVSVGGVAVALAAKDTLSNLFGSLTIFTDRPFQIGDWVMIGSDIEGIVEEVGFRSTRIRTFPDSQITVPNATVANSSVNNFGRRTYRRVKLDLSLRYDTPRQAIIDFKDAVRAHLDSREAFGEKGREVRLTGLGDHGISVLVLGYLNVPDWSTEMDEKEMLFLEILRIAEELNVGLAYPSSSVYVEAMPRPSQG